MTDRSRHDPDVADHLASWLDREACIDALCEALRDAAAECEELLRDNRALQAALTDKCTEAARLRRQVAELRRDLERAWQANRERSRRQGGTR